VEKSLGASLSELDQIHTRLHFPGPLSKLSPIFNLISLIQPSIVSIMAGSSIIDDVQTQQSSFDAQLYSQKSQPSAQSTSTQVGESFLQMKIQSGPFRIPLDDSGQYRAFLCLNLNAIISDIVTTTTCLPVHSILGFGWIKTLSN
jgi:hypothetical protein